MQNEFDAREEVVFVEYNRVVRNADQYLIHALGNKYYDLYKGFLDIDKLRGIDMDTALTVAHLTSSSNLFYEFKKGPLPVGWYDSYVDLMKADDDMYSRCTLLDPAASLLALYKQKFVKKIIIWTPFEDPRVVEDLYVLFSDLSKFTFVHGNLKNYLEQEEEKITCYMLGDVYHMEALVNHADLEFTEVMIGKYRFNLKESDEGMMESVLDIDKLHEMNIKYTEFKPFNLQAKHFIKLINN